MIFILSACMFGNLQQIQKTQEKQAVQIANLEEESRKMRAELEQVQIKQDTQEIALERLKTPSLKKLKEPPVKDYEITKTETGAYTIKQRVWDNFWKAPGKFVSSVRFAKFRQDEVFQGYKLNGIRVHSFLYQLGLQNNDIILSLNGHDIKNTEGLKPLFDLLQSQSKIQIEVLRYDKKRTIKYEIK